ncbi:DNA topoisomerase III [Parasalinivibrio latis]|uniref:DNA topoisomerase III n=1 Tax=Parasalinivibrio latis TaxID=2952610 RepID=UPI0030E05D72
MTRSGSYRLIIAEKPSLARAIAAVLPRPHKQQKGFIETAGGDIVTWCIGHLLEQAEPEAYDEKYKQWRLEDLPIVPDNWILKPRKTAASQLQVVKKLLKDAGLVVHAGDPDREGQLLVDEVIDHARLPQSKKKSVQRLLVNDLNPQAVKKALSKLRSNEEFVPLSVSALARSRADWLYGMNMSRLYTLLGRQAGYNGVLSVGRVQTPVLGLVVARDEEIENFVSKPYYQVDAVIPYQGFDIRARWQPSEACAKWQDEQGRVLSRPLAENVAQRITGQPATVKESDRKDKKHAPPLPYSLSALQIDAAKRFRMSANDVLSCCQSLYEKHKLITYPRSDCRYLPKGHFGEAKDVSKAVASTDPALSNAVRDADFSLKSRAWNDSKVEAHHAIIPTSKSSSPEKLTRGEQQVYNLIARQYLMQFYPHAVSLEAKLVFEIAGGLFVAKGKMWKSQGWRALMGKDDDEDEALTQKVPPLNVGEVLKCERGEVLDKVTEPPAYFTEATLLQAMTGIARYVKDTSLKSILRETDGLGTEATRAGILELLFKRSFLAREGKSIRSTPSGRGLIHALPDMASTPDMTAHWEHQLQLMAERQGSYKQFMDGLTQRVGEIIQNGVKSGAPQSLRGLPSKPAFKSGGKKGYRRNTSGAKSAGSKTTTGKGTRRKAAAPKR